VRCMTQILAIAALAASPVAADEVTAEEPVSEEVPAEEAAPVEEAALEEPVAEEATPEETTPVEPEEAPYQRGGPELETHGWIAIGLGGALLVAGAITGGMALDLDADLEERCAGGVCQPEDHDDLDTRNSLATSSTVLLGAGALVAAAGVVVLAAFAPREADAEPAVSVSADAGPGRVAASLGWRF